MKLDRVAILTIYITFCSGDSSFAQPDRAVEFGFAVNDTAPKDARVTRVGLDGCGDVVYARIDKIPSLDSQGYLSPDKVIEIDSKNKVVRRWPKPLGSSVLAIEGDRILIEDRRKFYAIDSAGNFQLQRHKPNPKAPQLLSESPAKHPEFKNSGYARLWKYTDRTGKIHRFIYEGACT